MNPFIPSIKICCSRLCTRSSGTVSWNLSHRRSSALLAWMTKVQRTTLIITLWHAEPTLSTRTLSLIGCAIFNPRWLFRVPGNRRPRRRAARILQTCTNFVDMFFRMLITAKSANSLLANHWPSSLDTRLLTHGATTSLLTTDGLVETGGSSILLLILQ